MHVVKNSIHSALGLPHSDLAAPTRRHDHLDGAQGGGGGRGGAQEGGHSSGGRGGAQCGALAHPQAQTRAACMGHPRMLPGPRALARARALPLLPQPWGHNPGAARACPSHAMHTRAGGHENRALRLPGQPALAAWGGLPAAAGVLGQ